MKKTFAAIIATALMTSTALAPAFAQTNNATPATPAAPTAPAETNTMAPAAGSAMSAAGDAAYLTQQTETQVSANEYIGKQIYNAGDESIGKVNDLILEQNGGIVAAVVGVGGFLGIGAKDVALPMSKVSLTRDAANNNDVRLTTTETAEALQAAPEFKTLSDKQAATDTTTTSSTTTAPATSAAPATPSTGGDTNSSTAPKP
ncbi:PRC-barrel domain-containing protein [Aliirhizobium smilacinae]|uniref:PRC-barrel domain containing protein n=1 Tax=Aliirhizobium smilacinae TaxID=1395944 RepID=A0A5C4XSC6_9HYPH|nr:PRC-barrel domain-containing protein [Rhizobium smilacinae]TNM65961.1 PRC-barrel domain containing protein [Rhizobium smilacinae]